MSKLYRRISTSDHTDIKSAAEPFLLGHIQPVSCGLRHRAYVPHVTATSAHSPASPDEGRFQRVRAGLAFQHQLKELGSPLGETVVRWAYYR